MVYICPGGNCTGIAIFFLDKVSHLKHPNVHVFQINDNNEFYAGALSIDKHSSPLQLVSIILKVDNFQ